MQIQIHIEHTTYINRIIQSDGYKDVTTNPMDSAYFIKRAYLIKYRDLENLSKPSECNIFFNHTPFDIMRKYTQEHTKRIIEERGNTERKSNITYDFEHEAICLFNKLFFEKKANFIISSYSDMTFSGSKSYPPVYNNYEGKRELDNQAFEGLTEKDKNNTLNFFQNAFIIALANEPSLCRSPNRTNQR